MAFERGMPLKIPSFRASEDTDRMGARSDRGGATTTGRALSSGRQTLATAMEKAGI